MGFALREYLIVSMCMVNICYGVSYLCNNTTLPGDFQISILLTKHYGTDCNKATTTGTVNPIGDNIMRWAARTLPSRSIGLRVIDTCGSISVNAKAISEAVSWRNFMLGEESNQICSAGALQDSIALVTTMPINSEDTVYALSEAAIPLIVATDGYHETEPLESSVIALGHSIRAVSKAIAKLMVALKWDFITVVHSDDRIGIDSYQTFQLEAERHQICIDQALTLKLPSPDLDDINTQGVVYFGSDGLGYQLLTGQDLKNKTWITTLDVRGLNINNGRVYSVLRSEGDLLTDALAIFGEALTMTVNDEGCNSGDIETCGRTQQFKQKLVENTRNVRNMNMTYTINDNGVVSSGDISHSTTFDVYRHNASSKVTTISLETGVTTDVQEYSSLCVPESPKDTSCRDKCRHLNDNKYLYIHGDQIIIVAIAIHEEGSNVDDRWSCKNYTRLGLFRTEAARFTFNYLLSSGVAKVNGESFGMLVMDSCGDKLKTAGEVYDIIRGNKKICDRDGNCLDHNSIAAFIGDGVSSVTEQIQTVLRRVPIIQIAYGASSVALSNRKEYPYFLRTNPPDDLQAHFMVELMKKIDSMPGNNVSAVNLLYTDSLYGRTASEKLRESLRKAGICVHLERKVKEIGSNDFNKIVENILDDEADVRLIVVIMDVHHLQELLGIINATEHRSSWLRGAYSFIFSDTWDENRELLKANGDIIKGSFSFSFITGFKSDTFGKKLISRALPTLAHENPWMSTLEQLVGDCKLPGNFLGTSSTLCTTPGEITQYQNESFTLHLMKAIMVTVRGLSEELPKGIIPGVYYNFDDIKRRYDILRRKTVPQTLEGGSIDHNPFTLETPDSDTYGNGGVGYAIYNIKKNQKYELLVKTGSKLTDSLGEFNVVPVYWRNEKVIRGLISKSDKENCKMQTPANHTQFEELKIGLAATGAVLGLLIIVIVVLVIVFMRARRQRKNENKSELPDGIGSDIGYSHYLSADQIEAIKNVHEDSRIELSVQPSMIRERCNLPNNRPLPGADNLGYKRSVHDSAAKLNLQSDACSIDASDSCEHFQVNDEVFEAPPKQEQKCHSNDEMVVSNITKV